MTDATLNEVDIHTRVEHDRFDAVTITMHWVSLLLIIVIFATAFGHEKSNSEAAADAFLLAHRSAGVLLWMLTLARLTWKFSGGRVVALPETMALAQRIAARANEYGLYCLLVLQPITGFLQSVLHGKPFPLLGFTFPEIMERNRGLTKFFHGTHEISAWLLVALITLHATAALLHQFILRDEVLRAMLPGRRRG